MSTNIALLEKHQILSVGKVFDAFKQTLTLSTSIDGLLPHQQINLLWDTYKANCESNNNINGKVFEALIALVMLENNISPIYAQAKVIFVPNVNFDLILYSKEYGPISISAKTSLRERYKQADLESVSLKYVHRKARCFLVTMDKVEASRLGAKLNNGDLLGIDKIVMGNEQSFDEMIGFLSTITLVKPQAVEIITSSQFFELKK